MEELLSPINIVLNATNFYKLIGIRDRDELGTLVNQFIARKNLLGDIPTINTLLQPLFALILSNRPLPKTRQIYEIFDKYWNSYPPKYREKKYKLFKIAEAIDKVK